MLYPKYFCRIEKSKLAFDLNFAGYKNEKENIHFTPVKQEVIEIINNDNYSSIIAEQQQEQENTTAVSSNSCSRERERWKKEWNSISCKDISTEEETWRKENEAFKRFENKRFAYERYQFKYK